MTSRFPVIASVLVFLALSSCTQGVYLKTETPGSAELTGTYTLILYGARYRDDIENLAIFAKDGTRYAFQVYAPRYRYKVEKRVPAKEALETAQEFIRFHRSFWQSQLSKILSPEGETIGYELKPLYYPIDTGYADVLSVYYVVEGNTVTAIVRLKPEIEKIFPDEDLLFPSRGVVKPK